MKKVIRITEGELNRIVKRVIMESEGSGFVDDEFKKPSFKKINSIKIVSESDFYYLVINISVDNPYRFNLKIKQYDLDITIDGIYLGNAEMTDDVVILTKNNVTNFDVRIKLDSGLDSTIKLFKSFISKEDHTLNIKGSIVGGVMIISKKIEVDETTKFKNKGIEGLNNFIDKVDLGSFNYLKDDIKKYVKKGEDVINTIKGIFD
jgi:LEA14-like dessication related protein